MRSKSGLKTLLTRQGRTIQASVLVLAVFLLCSGVNPVLLAVEQPNDPSLQDPGQKKTATIRSEVARRGVGAHVRVKLRDKHELKGQITQIDDSSFQLVIDQDGLDAQSEKDRQITIPYAEVDKIRGPISRAASVANGRWGDRCGNCSARGDRCSGST